MKTSINKIGGENMGRPMQVIDVVRARLEAGENPVFVVSALKGSRKEEKTTDMLIAGADTLNGTDYTEADIDSAFSAVLKYHTAYIEEHFRGENVETAKSMLEKHFGALKAAVLKHGETSKTLAPAEGSYAIRDQIVGFGEQISANLFTLLLKQEGIEAELSEDAGCSEDVFTGDVISRSKVHAECRNAIEAAVPQVREGVVRVLGGWIKGTPKGMAISVSRGYTDTTGVNTHIVLRERGEEVTVTYPWKAVPGAMSADPNDLGGDAKQAVVHDDLSINEALQMAGAGSGLMQIDALALAAEHNVPLHLRDIREPKNPTGTRYSNVEIQTGNAFKTIVSNPNVDTISFKCPEMSNRDGFLAAVTAMFAKRGIAIGDIPSSSTSMTITVPLPKDKADREAMRDKMREVLDELRTVIVDNEAFATQERKWKKGDLASLSVIGDELPNSVGIFGEITSYLAAHGIDIKNAIQDDYQTRILFLISREKLELATRILHKIFIEKDSEFIATTRTLRDRLSDALVSKRGN